MKEEYKHTCPYSIACSHDGTEECEEDHIECRYFLMLANIQPGRIEHCVDGKNIVHIIEHW